MSISGVPGPQGGGGTGSGSGDVTGPASGTDNAIVRFDGTGGKTLQDSDTILTDNDEIRAGAGSKTTPTYSASADTNTGMWLPGSDVIGWSTGAVDAMALGSNLILGNGRGLNFASGDATGGGDTGVNRNAAGTMEVNNGTLGTFRDLKCRGITQTGQTVVAYATTTMSGNATLTATSELYQNYDPNGADRDVTFEATPSTGSAHVVSHTGTANTLTVKANGGATINTVSSGLQYTYIYNGTSWTVTLNTQTKQVAVLLAAISATDDLIVFEAPYAMTLKELRVKRTGGTSADVNFRKNSVTALLAADYTTTTSYASAGAVTNGSFAARDHLEVRVTAISGAQDLQLQANFIIP